MWYFAKKLYRRVRTLISRRSGYEEIDGNVNSGHSDEFDDVTDEEFFQDIMGYGRSYSPVDKT